MDKIRLIIPSRAKHCNEVITGALMLRQQGWDVELEDCSREDSPFRDLPVVQAEYRGKKLFYDVWDGYQDPEDMELLIEIGADGIMTDYPHRLKAVYDSFAG